MERIGKLPTKFYSSVVELPQELQEVILTTDVLYDNNGMPYRKYIKHHSFGTFLGREGDYDYESVMICTEAPMPNRESQSIVALSGKIGPDVWKEINKKNRLSSNNYQKPKHVWKRSKGIK